MPKELLEMQLKSSSRDIEEEGDRERRADMARKRRVEGKIEYERYITIETFNVRYSKLEHI